MINEGATRSGFNKGLLAVGLVLALLCGLLFLVLQRPETPFMQAVALIRAGRAAAGLHILEELSRQQPDNTAVFPWLAQGYLSTERLAEGRTALDTALRLKLPSESLVPVVLSYANYYESRSDFDEAEKLFSSAQSACLPKDLNAGRAQLYLRWAESDVAQDKLLAAVEHLELANNLVPDPNDLSKKEILHHLSDYYRRLAAIAETKDKDDQKALNYLQKSLIMADEPATRMALANIHWRRGDIDKAIENYSIVSQSDENNLEARHRLIDLLVQKQDYVRAQEALMDLTDKEKSLENYHLLASLNLKMENYAGAVHALEDAINLRANDPDLLQELENVLRNWTAVLTKQGKSEEAISVKGHADRVHEMVVLLVKKDEPKEEVKENQPWNPSTPPIALSSSRIWLSKGSLTPEGEIQIKNITGAPVGDLSLTVVFFDNTSKNSNGTVILPVAVPTSAPFLADAARSLYFSCPNIVKADHQLAVIIFWKGRFLKELPVVKAG